MSSRKNASKVIGAASIERIDEIERYYEPISILDKVNSYLFWFSALLSILVLYKNKIPWPQFQALPEIIFAILVILHLVFELYIRFYLFPRAERKRIQQLLSNSLNTPVTTERTQNYYNNELPPSIMRLAANVFENTHFAKAISEKMALRARILFLIYFVVWLSALFWRSTDVGFLVTITQTLFSGEILEKWLQLEFLYRRNENYYDELYNIFHHNNDFNSPSVLASILDVFASYEVAKGISGIRISSSIFHAENLKLSAEWDNIRKRLKFD